MYFNPDLQFSKLSDGVIRLRAQEYFCGVGTLELSLKRNGAQGLECGGLLWVPWIGETYVIESMYTDSAADSMEIMARGVLSYLARRVLSEEITYTGRAEELLCDLAEEWGAAVVPGGISAVRQGLSAEVNIASRRGPLLSVMEDICTAAGLGMRLEFRPVEESFRFAVRQRCAAEILLSRSAGNLLNVRWVWDFHDYYNRAVVLGSGGNVVTADAAGCFNDGFDDTAQPTKELWVNSEELSMDRYLSESTYRAALLARGKQALAAHRPRISVEIDLTPQAANAVSPGDVCPVTELGAYALCTAKTVTLSDGKITRAAEMRLLGMSDN